MSSEKVASCFASCFSFASCIMKKSFFFMEERDGIFTMKLSSAALSYLNAR